MHCVCDRPVRRLCVGNVVYAWVTLREDFGVLVASRPHYCGLPKPKVE